MGYSNDYHCIPSLQAKGYAKTNGNLMQTNLEDISSMKVGCAAKALNIFDSPTTANLILSTFFLLNILILTFTMLYLQKVFIWLQKQGRYSRNLYKAIAIVLTSVNSANITGDVLMYTIFPLPDPSILKILLMILTFILDISICCFTTFRYTCNRWHKIMHAFALCHIVWFVHRVSTDAIISIILFAIAPAQTLGIVTLLLSTLACAIILLAQLINNCRCGRETLSSLLIAAITVALVLSVTLLFIALVDNGLKSAGMGGFILSLIPPAVIFVISLFINREILIKFGLANTTTGSADAHVQESTQMSEATQADENTNLIPKAVAIQIESDEEEQ